MNKFFKYNWQVRDQWFEWCNQLTSEELLKKRTGGAGSILYTLFHIIDVESSWIRAIQGKEDITFSFENKPTLESLKALSDNLRIEIADFLQSFPEEGKDELVTAPWVKEAYTRDSILHHVIAHEIHHIGQLSVWARELQLKPVSANFIGRKLQ